MKYFNLTALPTSRCYPAQHLRHQRGMTLVEWMVSLTIGLILMAGLTALIARQSSTQAELEKSSRQIENGRYAMQLLNEDIKMAGYYGEFSDVSTATPASTDPCSTNLIDIDGLLAFPVQGYDNEALTTIRPTCIAAGNHVPGTDILVVRSVEPAPLTIATAAAGAGGHVYLQSGLAPSGLTFSKIVGKGADTSVFTLFTKDGVTSAPLRKLLVHVYFISPCSTMAGSTCTNTDDGSKPIPTLKRLELSASGATTTMLAVPLVEGIENMQIDYGIDNVAPGDGAPDGQFVSATADWANVMALRIHLLARSNDSSPGYVDPKTYTMGVKADGAAQTVTPGLAYKRRLFSQLIRVVNPSARRDG